jgi:hypothetical protein
MAVVMIVLLLVEFVSTIPIILAAMRSLPDALADDGVLRETVVSVILRCQRRWPD